MKKMYHLASCTTCQAIIKETRIDKAGVEMQNIREEKITVQQLEKMKKMVTILNNKIFIGNDKKTVEALKKAVK